MFRQKIRGVTLIEIVIASLIIGIALVPVLSSIQYGGKSTVKINNYSKVERLAQELIEECKHVPVRLYYRDYNTGEDNVWYEVNEQYYPKSNEVIDEFKKSLKSFDFKAQLKVVKLKDIIREIWIKISIDWKEGDSKLITRQLRLANSIYNPEAD